jgi:hypothetical protein
MNEETQNILSALQTVKKHRGKKSKYTFSKDEFQQCIDELEQKGTYPNRNRLYIAISLSPFGRKYDIPSNVCNLLVNKYGVSIKTKRAAKGRKSNKDKLNLGSTSPTSSHKEKSPKSNIDSPQAKLKASVAAKRKADNEGEAELERKYLEVVQANGTVVYYPAGSCPIQLLLDVENVYDWCQQLFEYGIVNGTVYYPTALFYYSNRYYPVYTQNGKLIREKIVQWLVQKGLGEFIS